jgi:GT2 family glycosyltransferase
LAKWRALGLSPATDWLYRRYQAALVPANRSYRDWVRRYDTLTDAELRLLAADAVTGPRGALPRFSILLPVYDTPEHWLRRCLDSVLAQTFGDWELCIVDDASPAPHVRRVLASYQARDPRIRVEFRGENGHISVASNTALEMARGSYVCLLDHDDELRPNALHELASAVAATPGLVLIYSDEDKIDEGGERFEPYFKPDWNPDLLLGQNYVCHLMAIRTEAARACGGFRRGFEGSQDHDLVLRVSRGLAPTAIHHIPKVLYHWRAIPGSTALRRDAKDYAAVAGARAVQEAVAQDAPGARVEVLDHGHYRVHWPLPDPAPRVSMIVPTRDRPALLRTCVRSLLERTHYPDIELILVDNGTVDPEALALLDDLAADPRVTLLRYDAAFNYSAINNWAASQATGQVLALINNDIEVIDSGWLGEMVAQAMRPGVGAVGAMLLYPDGRIQHAGVVLGLGGIANHAYVGQPGDAPGHGGRARVVQSLGAVTAACLVVRREAFEAVGGLDERLAVAFNDIDFCLRLREAGLRNLWTPFARLNHHESASRGSDESGEKRERFLGEVALMEVRWRTALENDPAYNPNLSLVAPGHELADPPRR